MDTPTSLDAKAGPTARRGRGDQGEVERDGWEEPKVGVALCDHGTFVGEWRVCGEW
jgi:hypothetical protein